MKFRTLGMSGRRVFAELTNKEVARIDQALDTMKMSEVFGGSKVVGKGGAS